PGEGQSDEQAQANSERSAARAAQEAARAQEQAMRGQADAAQEAAQALAMAAQSMSQSNEPGDDDSPGQESSHKPGSKSGKNSDKPGSKPAMAKNSSKGIQGSEGSADGIPLAASDMGISASDWAKLTPLTQRELLNVSQQTGPASYREMIKNYYVRVA